MSPVTRGISFGESFLYSLHRLIDAAAICLTVALSLRHTATAGVPELLVIDARLKPHHAPPLVADPETVRRVDNLAAPSGPLHGII